MERPVRRQGEALEQFVRRCYCLCEADGYENPARLERAIAAVEAADVEVPDVPGVPRLRDRVEQPSQIPAIVGKYLAMVEGNPRLHPLSFVDPLIVANELGIAVSPLVARVVRRGLAGHLTFDRRLLDSNGNLVGVRRIQWIPVRREG